MTPLSGFLSGVGALVFLANAAVPIHAQSAPPTRAPMEKRVEDAAASMAKNPRMRSLTPEQRRALVEFVTGNLVFVMAHEFGHTLISEMGLPVLGKEEDAADSFATIMALKMGTSFSQRVLMDAAMGWFMSDKRDRKEHVSLAFYDEHGLDKQRAYSVVCLMVGSDPEKFKALADEAKLPEDRQATCAGDFSNASWSWEQVLKPHMRSPDQPKTEISVAYLDGGPKYEPIREAAQSMNLLEVLAERASDVYAWRKPFHLEMRSCGEPNAHWDLDKREIFVCYELAEEFAQLYRQYGINPTAAKKPAHTAKPKASKAAAR
jgi:Putative metallopeptidase